MKNALLDMAQGASNAAASTVSAPVDAIAWLLRKAGVNIPAPVGGSDWMAAQGLTKQPKNALAGIAGESLGMVSPMMAAAKAPQIANALLQADQAAKRGAFAVGQRGADMAESYMRRSGMMPAMTSPEYSMAHRPMTVKNGAATLDDLTPSFGDDIYGPYALDTFGTGDRSLDMATLRVLKSLRGKPDELVPVYRAVPKSAQEQAFQPGDWVTINKRYAMMHGGGQLNGDYRIIEQRVPASWLTTNADSFHEQGFYPK